MSEPVRWFAAVVLLRSEIAGRDAYEALVDHQVRLVHATDAEEAFARAEAIGAAEEHAYTNEAGETVSWRYAGIFDLQELLEQPMDGAEVYSWFNAEGSPATVPPKHELAVFQFQGDISAGSDGDDREPAA